MVCSFARQALTMMVTDLGRAGVCSRLVAESSRASNTERVRVLVWTQRRRRRAVSGKLILSSLLISLNDNGHNGPLCAFAKVCANHFQPSVCLTRAFLNSIWGQSGGSLPIGRQEGFSNAP